MRESLVAAGLALLLSGLCLDPPPLEARGAHAAQAPGPPLAPAGRAPPRARYVVAAIGDSLSDVRVGGGRYMKQLGQRCPESRFDAYGVGGQQTSHMLRRIRQDLFGDGHRGSAEKPRYTHVVVLAGVNDVTGAQGFAPSAASIERNLSALYGAARERGARVVAVSIPPWGFAFAPEAQRRATDEINSWILAQKATGLVDEAVDIRPELRRGGADLCPRFRRSPGDRVHWNAAGHAVVAEALRREVFSDCE